MHYLLGRLLNETVLQYSTLYYQTEEASLSMPVRSQSKISANVTVGFVNRQFARDIHF